LDTDSWPKVSNLLFLCFVCCNLLKKALLDFLVNVVGYLLWTICTDAVLWWEFVFASSA
jgi:hypothetical protein